MPRDASGRITPGRLGEPRPVPASIPHPEYVGRSGPSPYGGPDRYPPAQLTRIRAAGRAAARALAAAGEAVRPGVTTDELDRVVHETLIACGAYPSTLGYYDYPRSCCTSVNEVAVHGIPDDTVLVDGDLVTIDVTAYLDGMHGDTNATFVVGEAPDAVRDFVERARRATLAGIAAVRPGGRLRDVARAIRETAERGGDAVVPAITGHGIGVAFHTGLVIPHVELADADRRLEPGMVFTVEPVLVEGGALDPLATVLEEWDDGWTTAVRGGRRTAQFEHTIAVTELGAAILTLA